MFTFQRFRITGFHCMYSALHCVPLHMYSKCRRENSNHMYCEASLSKQQHLELWACCLHEFIVVTTGSLKQLRGSPHQNSFLSCHRYTQSSMVSPGQAITTHHLRQLRPTSVFCDLDNLVLSMLSAALQLAILASLCSACSSMNICLMLTFNTCK